ncbi:MAG: NUDIX hydrolase [Nitrososphaera sp.]|jgi:ADP-ribose pyrophosphatase
MLKNAPKGWRLKSSRQVYDNHYLKVYEDRLGLAGHDKLYIRGVRRDYSTIVPFAPEGKGILTIRSYRHLADSYQLEVPSGYIDEGETPRQAAIRELGEETGYVAKKMVFVGSYTLDYSMFIQTGNVFAAYGLQQKAGRRHLGDMEKISKVEFMPVEKVKKMLLLGRILNAATIVALYRALHYHEEEGRK